MHLFVDFWTWYGLGWVKIWALTVWVLDEYVFACSWQRLCDHNEYLITGIDMVEERLGCDR